MATPYEDIFSRFLKRIEDKDLPKYTEDERQEMMTNWLDMAIGYIELDGLKIKNDLSDRDNDLQEFTADLSNGEKEIINKLKFVFDENYEYMDLDLIIWLLLGMSLKLIHWKLLLCLLVQKMKNGLLKRIILKCRKKVVTIGN